MLLNLNFKIFLVSLGYVTGLLDHFVIRIISLLCHRDIIVTFEVEFHWHLFIEDPLYHHIETSPLIRSPNLLTKFFMTGRSTFTLSKKWSFPFGHIYWRNLNGKLHFMSSVNRLRLTLLPYFPPARQCKTHNGCRSEKWYNWVESFGVKNIDTHRVVKALFVTSRTKLCKYWRQRCIKPLMHATSKNGQTDYKNLPPNAASFLNCAWPFWGIMH